MNNLSIIIVHYKGLKDTLECLFSLERLSLSDIDLQIFLIDNSGELNTSEDFKKLKLHIHYIKTPENLGFSEGNNLGIKESLKLNPKYIILLNNDTLVPPVFLMKFLESVSKNPDFGLASPRIYFAKGYEYHKDKYSKNDLGKVIWYAGGELDWNNIYAKHTGVDEVDKGQYKSPKQVDFATGCCMFINPKVIDKIGLFDKNYFVYYEDVDYSIRAKKAGFSLYYLPEPHIYHKNATSSGKPGSQLHVYYQTRNRYYLGSKFARYNIKLHLYKEALKNILLGPEIKRLAARDFFIQNMGKGSFSA